MREARRANHDEIDGIINEWTVSQEHYAVMRRLQKAGIAAGPVLDQRDAYNDPHLKRREVFEQVSQEDSGTHLYPGAPYKFGKSPWRIQRRAPHLGEHNEQIYGALGTTAAELTSLRSDGVI